MSKAHEVRAALFNRKLREFPIDFVIEGLEMYTNELSVLELTGTDTSHANKLAVDSDGKSDPILSQAAVVCKSLIIRETKERVFADLDLDMVAGMGLSVLKPVGDLVTQVSGLDPAAFEVTKKNWKSRQEKNSNSNSIVTSEELGLARTLKNSSTI